MLSTKQIIEDLSNKVNEQREKYSTIDVNLRLRQAALVGDLDEVRQLLTTHHLESDHAQSGINPKTNAPYSGQTALHLAALNNHEEVCKILLNYGWSPVKKDAKGQTVQSLATSPSVQHLLNHYHATGNISTHLSFVFEQLKLLERLPQKKPHTTLRALSLACGEAYEFLCLAQMYPDIHWEFVGVDNDGKSINEMTQRFPTISNAHWHCLDATNEDQMKNSVPGRFDIVFIRHPNISNMTEIFASILLNILPMKIKPDGMLFMSTYHREELEDAYQIIQSNFHSCMGGNFCESTDEIISINGYPFSMDGYSVVLTPTPALQLKIAAEQKVTQNTEERPAISVSM